MFKFKMGIYVTDIATNFEGIINGRVVWDDGCIQYSVKPPVRDGGDMLDGRWVDGDYFCIDKNKGVTSKYGDPNFKFSNGDKVKSIIVPFEGTITGQFQYLNGCLEYRVTSKSLHEGHPIHEVFPETELKSTGRPVKRETRITGGPDKKSHL